MGKSDFIRVPLPAARMMAVGRWGVLLFIGFGDSQTKRNGTGEMGQELADKELGDMDSNHDKQYQKLLCYRYTIAQTTMT